MNLIVLILTSVPTIFSEHLQPFVSCDFSSRPFEVLSSVKFRPHMVCQLVVKKITAFCPLFDEQFRLLFNSNTA